MSAFTFKPTQFDVLGQECGSCEGQAILDAEGNCRLCAEEIALDPWAVVDVGDGHVIRRGLAWEHAQHVARVHTPGVFAAAAGVRPRVVRERDLPDERR